MSTAFVVAGIVAVIAALVATLTKRGENAEAGMAAATSDGPVTPRVNPP
ncbi:hypothetical protein [Streptomyces sp. NBC_00727]